MQRESLVGSGRMRATKWPRSLPILVATCLCVTLNLHCVLASPAVNNVSSSHHLHLPNLAMPKYERHSRHEESSPLTTTSPSPTAGNTQTPTPPDLLDRHRFNDRQSDSDLYTLQLGQHNQRQLKHDHIEVYDLKCPKQHSIHPCDCLELDKRVEMLEGSGELLEPPTNTTPTVEMIEEEPLNPDLIETVAFCKNIRNVQVLTEAVRGFQGHRVNYFVLDGCKLPPFPNNLFKGIHVVWMEILNSTLQFHDNFFSAKFCP